MIEQDTIKLLRECDAGTKMGITSIDDVLSHTRSAELHNKLTRCKDEHEHLQVEIQQLLGKYKDEGKDPNPICGEGVLIELVQAPKEVIEAYDKL